MARSRLQRCDRCKTFGLGEKCDKCGSKMEAVASLKFSPEDPQGARRRKRQDAGSKKWIKSLPSARKEEGE
ncbi:MAG: ribosome biogenesis protein [Euryarchaeota archaeon]|nr:ribosome biogenesis protein [Euryarchaeota archaeon]|tara:strand:+ start:1217 stop:1429 length:213 start_codon:yes stop_codon:yes gene_type:complete